MAHRYKKWIRTLFVLLCVTFLLALQSCINSKSTNTTTNRPSVESSEQSIPQPANQGNPSTTITCPLCGGSGLCPTCQGQGQLNIAADGTYEDCPTCHGSGICWRCGGTGFIPAN